ncbi:MAG TPA: hypothetical protein VN823_10460 [Stellaceae bacterium]|nr:hypothetical protein [Stellaceae bacterium]
MAELCDLSAVELRQLIGRKSISPVELLESCLRRIEAVNPRAQRGHRHLHRPRQGRGQGG